MTVHLVLPGDVDDPARPSGGNVYGRRVRDGLPAARAIALSGSWPDPDAAARRGLDRVLAGIPDGATVLLDGLVACGVPDVVVPHAARLRTVVLVHLPLGCEAGAAPGLDAAERRVLHAAAAVVATSRWTAGQIVRRHGVPATRVHVAAPGADPAPVAAGGGGLLCVGSLTRTKGQDLLVEALARVADRPWTCRLVGALDRDQVHVARVRSLVADHGLGDRIRLDGPLSGDDLDGAFHHADLLVLPSRTEAFGMVVREAAARAVPVLAADVGGVREALGAGWLVPGNDVDVLADALASRLDEPAPRDRAAALRARPLVPGWDTTLATLAAVLDEVASAGVGTSA